MPLTPVVHPLRDYQEKAVSALLCGGGGSLVVIPTGGGKTRVIAEYCRRVESGRVLYLAHNEDLVRQSAKIISDCCGEPAGIYCSGLGAFDLLRRVTVGTVQSFSILAGRQKDPLRLIHHSPIPAFSHVVIDEAHHVPPKTRTWTENQYGRVLAAIEEQDPSCVIVGLTATPWRSRDPLVGDSSQSLFREIVFQVSVERLIDDGYLCPPLPAPVDLNIDPSKVRTVGDDYSEADSHKQLFPHTQTIAETIAATERRRIVVFASNIPHAEELRAAIQTLGIASETITHKTPKAIRTAALNMYREGTIQCLVNVNTIEEGIDVPDTNLVVLARMTKSKRRYYQEVGRGLRPHPSKTNCMVLDFAGNIARLGPINLLFSLNHKTEANSNPNPATTDRPAPPLHPLDKNPAFNPAETVDLEKKPSTMPLIAKEHLIQAHVSHIAFSIHHKKKDETVSKTLKITFVTHLGCFYSFLCFNKSHHPFALQKTKETWRDWPGASILLPTSEEEALNASPRLHKPETVLISYSSKYPVITQKLFAISPLITTQQQEPAQ